MILKNKKTLLYRWYGGLAIVVGGVSVLWYGIKSTHQNKMILSY